MWRNSGSSPQGFQQFHMTAMKSNHSSVLNLSLQGMHICCRVLTFYAVTEPAAVYYVAKNEQPTENKFFGLGFFAPSIVLATCLQKNKPTCQDIIDSAAMFRRSSPEVGWHLDQFAMVFSLGMSFSFVTRKVLGDLC